MLFPIFFKYYLAIFNSLISFFAILHNKQVATKHKLKNKKNIFFYPTIGIILYKRAAVNAPLPSITDVIDINADLFPFTYGYSDKSNDIVLLIKV